MRKLIVSTALVLAAGLAFSTTASNAGLVDNPAPLRLKIVSKDGKPKLKVQKKLPVLISCSKDCRARIKMTIVTPVGKDDIKDAGPLPAGTVLTVRFPLTNFGLNYLKKNFRNSKLKVNFSAKDLETGKRVTKTRSFGFYR